MNIYGKNCHYFSASSKLPEAFPSGEVYKFVDVGVIIDVESMEIVDASVTLVSRAAKGFLSSKIIGQRLTEEGVNEIEEELKRTYHGTALKAVVVALRQIHEKVKLFVSG